MRITISDKAKDLLPRILKEIEAEGLMNWEVEWLARQISHVEQKSHEMAPFKNCSDSQTT